MMKTSIYIMLSIMMLFGMLTNNVIAEENEDNSLQEVSTENIEVENEDENKESDEIIIEDVEQEQDETNDLESNNDVVYEESTNAEDQLLTQPTNNDEITVSNEDELKDALATNKKVIYIDGVIYTGSLEIPEGNSVTIKSVDGGFGDITSNGNGAFLLNVNKGATLTLEGSLTLSGNDKVPVLAVEGECTIKDGVVISDGYSSNSNSTQLKGGGITIDGGTLHLEGGTIENNIYAVKYTTGHGGAGIYAKNGSTLYMNNGSIINNLAGTEGNDTFGGGICLDGSKAIISGGIIANNVAYNRGGGINVSIDSILEINGNVEIKNNIVRGNTSAYYKSGGGGGIYNEGKLIMTAGIISGNEAYRGGGICNAGASGGLYPPGSSIEDEDKIAILSNVQITNNKAFYGAGIFNSTYVELSNSTVKGNTLTKNISATSIAPNTYPTDGGAYGGGIYNGQYKSSSSRDKGQYGILNLKDGNTISDNSLEGSSELGHGTGIFQGWEMYISGTNELTDDNDVTLVDDTNIIADNGGYFKTVIYKGEEINNTTPINVTFKLIESDQETIENIGRDILVTHDENVVDADDLNLFKVTLLEDPSLFMAYTEDDDELNVAVLELSDKPYVSEEKPQGPSGTNGNENNNDTWDDGGPFTTDICGSIYDRWGNLIYQAPNCEVHDGYKVPNTGTR